MGDVTIHNGEVVAANFVLAALYNIPIISGVDYPIYVSCEKYVK